MQNEVGVATGCCFASQPLPVQLSPVALQLSLIQAADVMAGFVVLCNKNVGWCAANAVTFPDIFATTVDRANRVTLFHDLYDRRVGSVAASGVVGEVQHRSQLTIFDHKFVDVHRCQDCGGKYGNTDAQKSEVCFFHYAALFLGSSLRRHAAKLVKSFGSLNDAVNRKS